MISYLNGTMEITKNGNVLKSIIDIKFGDNLMLSVFPGSLSPNDILLKYKDGRNNIQSPRFRTPKHIHWVVDFMIKKEHERGLANNFLNLFKECWVEARPLTDRRTKTIYESLSLSKDNQQLSNFYSLNSYGYYNIDFLSHLMELLMIQEKTNNPNAYMFINVIEELISGDDLFKIISTATHR